MTFEERLREIFIPNVYRGRPPKDVEILGESPFSSPIGKAGMVMNPRNAKVIASKLGNILTQLGDKRVTHMDSALAYIKTKYPKLARIPKSIETEVQPRDVAGSFSSTMNRVFMNPIVTDSRSDLVETLAHELTHARQFMKDPKVFKNYIDVESKTGSLFSDYLAQSVEKNATQAGRTARATYEKFLSLLNK